MSDKKLIDEQHVISTKKGNGVLRREVWVDDKGNITRYNLAYINAQLFSGDNGRVIGFDNAHGYHHRHHYGKVEAVAFTSFEDMEILFEREWLALRSQ
ncbi:DUF6516 family protein [Methylotenera sp.]|uniref:toxin-antitoxin system TumE family protein n=1 Tax=Methylotenera sp. TaxID=2051956 RepID=UPI00272F9033|nr:DUF6516 family protein [Methylotenera sp.]MDP2229525.1 DUF6516 family protein [Methylotenera sp.]MDP3006200.1 DUF6516 family protein [Methylotenera sp.]MDP3140931.1 DUF6516 family protein [Methylotenera sp.]